jgi:hypothetical protein
MAAGPLVREVYQQLRPAFALVQSLMTFRQKAHGRASGMSQWEASHAVQRAGECARAVKARLSRQGGPL